MDKLELISNIKFHPPTRRIKSKKLQEILLKNRGLITEKEIKEFLNPDIKKISIKSLGINQKTVGKSLKRIRTAIDNKEKIIIYGDYDVDGITASAILWETLRDVGADVMPYMPHRVTHGYGLSEKGLADMLKEFPKAKVVITVDNGIVADNGVNFANKKGLDVVITDHHLPSKELPKAFSIVHTTKICGAAVAYILAKEIKKKFNYKVADNHLELVALATVADLMPLMGPNRAFLKKGLEELRETKRVGLLEIFKEAMIDKEKIGTYEIGHIIAPRLNAMGRLEHAIDSLRLLCTPNKNRAGELAKKLGLTNKDRQKLTFDTLIHAKEALDGKIMKKLIFISNETYEEGIIGLVAGRLAEEFYRPSIVISKGKLISKASARSVKGFNIIEFIRQAESYLVNAGGHPGAAGFSFETKNLAKLRKKLEDLAEKILDEKILLKKIRVDCELDLSLIGESLYKVLKQFEPFGMANPQPTFLAKGIMLESTKIVGFDGKHLKFLLRFGDKPENIISAIAFGMADRIESLKKGDKVDIVYTVEENIWNDRINYELRVKNLRIVD